MTIDTATVARALSRTLGGEWKYHKNWVGSGGWFETNDEARVRKDPREDTDVCLEMLHAAIIKWQEEAMPSYAMCTHSVGWGLEKGNTDENFMDFCVVTAMPISGQPFREAVIRLCAGEE